jgi:putative transposase
MPCKEITQVQARVRFIEDWLAKEHESLAVLCRVHGVSRKTGYKWVRRFKQGGRPALNDRSRRWRSHPQTTTPGTVELVMATRKRHPTWGHASCGRGFLCAATSVRQRRRWVRF